VLPYTIHGASANFLVLEWVEIYDLIEDVLGTRDIVF